MGRRRVEIKRIEDKSSRQVTFCKRRNGLMEKGRQLSTLCESSVAVLIVSATGKFYSYSSGDSMAKILSRFEIQQADDPKTSLVLHEKVYDMVSNLSYTKLSSRGEIGIELVCSSLPVLHQKVYGKDQKELLEIVQCKLEEAKSDNVSIDFLKSLEEQLKTALSITRDKKTELMMEFVKTLQEKEKLLREENQVLTSQLSKMKKSLETEEARAMPPENSSSKNPPETLLLLK